MVVFQCVMVALKCETKYYSYTVIQTVHLVCDTNETTFEDSEYISSQGAGSKALVKALASEMKKSGVGKCLRMAHMKS